MNNTSWTIFRNLIFGGLLAALGITIAVLIAESLKRYEYEIPWLLIFSLSLLTYLLLSIISIFVSSLKPLKETNSDILFGSINVETGETSKGYLKNGVMKFQKMPWYKRAFAKPPSQKEFLQTKVLEVSYKLFGFYELPRRITVSVYRDFNPFTQKTTAIYGIGSDLRVFFDIGAYEHAKELVVCGYK